MTWRTVVIRERAKLDYSLNFMTVRQEAGVRKISLGEIYMVIVENKAGGRTPRPPLNKKQTPKGAPSEPCLPNR